MPRSSQRFDPGSRRSLAETLKRVDDVGFAHIDGVGLGAGRRFGQPGVHDRRRPAGSQRSSLAQITIDGGFPRLSANAIEHERRVAAGQALLVSVAHAGASPSNIGISTSSPCSFRKRRSGIVAFRSRSSQTRYNTRPLEPLAAAVSTGDGFSMRASAARTAPFTASRSAVITSARELDVGFAMQRVDESLLPAVGGPDAFGQRDDAPQPCGSGTLNRQHVLQLDDRFLAFAVAHRAVQGADQVDGERTLAQQPRNFRRVLLFFVRQPPLGQHSVAAHLQFGTQRRAIFAAILAALRQVDRRLGRRGGVAVVPGSD